MADPNAPVVPPFLGQSLTDIATKFEQLQEDERFRTQLSAINPSPDFQFAKLGMAPGDAKALDRYWNIQPWANNRVRLQVPDGHLDYINASPVVLHSPADPADPDRPPLRYIAMQGPKVTTADHAWRMVAEQLQSPAVVVMLTETHELGMEKCYPYFPRTVDEEPLYIGQDDEFGDGFVAHITCDDVQDKADGAIQVRKLTLHVDGRDQDMTVWHLLYRKWPDFGVPALQDIGSFFELMKLSRDLNASPDNPRIVHCSAGVGRSGTFIALEHLMREVDSGALEYEAGTYGDDYDPVFETVTALRQQRKMMVQADAQFLFIYQVLRRRYMDKYGIPEDILSDEPAAKRLEVDPFVQD